MGTNRNSRQTISIELIHKAVLDCMNEAVYVIDRDMRVIYANPASEHISGITPAEAAGLLCGDVFCEPSPLCEGLCPPKRAMQERVPIFHREAETRSRRGGVLQTRISFAPFYSGEECVGAVLVITDITELREAQKAAEHQRNFLKTAIDSLTYPFFVIEAGTYRILLANKAASGAMLPLGMTCHELSHGSSAPCSSSEHPCPMKLAKETKAPVTVEHVHYDIAGKPRNMEVHCFPIFDDAGNVTEVIEYGIDVTDRKLAENEYRDLIRRLQDTLAELKTLQGLIPICASCKKIRDDRGYWNQLEAYISEHSSAEFTHGFCPECAKMLYPEYYREKPKDTK